MLLLGMGSQLMTPRSQGGGFAGLGNSALGISQAYGKSQSDKLYRQAQQEELQSRAGERAAKAAAQKASEADYQAFIDYARQQDEAARGQAAQPPAMQPHEPMVMPDSLAAQGVKSRFSSALQGAAFEPAQMQGQPQGQQLAQGGQPGAWSREMVARATLRGITPEQMALISNPSSIGKGKPLKLSQGERLLDPTTYQELANNPKEDPLSPVGKLMTERDKLPQGSPFRKVYDQAIAKATTHQPGTNITVKSGDSMAAQVGKIMEGQRTGMDGAMRMFNSADQLGMALDSGQVITGPGADVKTKALQIGRVLGVTGKTSDEMLVNTRAAIKSLAEMGVQARKELAGQGQITEKEAEAVQKAYAGDLSSLTEGELRMLVDVTKRAASLRAKGYESQLQSVPKELQPFYTVPGLGQVSGYKSGGAASPSTVRQQPSSDFESAYKQYAR
jgi:hypothetical protein